MPDAFCAAPKSPAAHGERRPWPPAAPPANETEPVFSNPNFLTRTNSQDEPSTRCAATQQRPFHPPAQSEALPSTAAPGRDELPCLQFAPDPFPSSLAHSLHCGPPFVPIREGLPRQIDSGRETPFSQLASCRPPPTRQRTAPAAQSRKTPPPAPPPAESPSDVDIAKPAAPIPSSAAALPPRNPRQAPQTPSPAATPTTAHANSPPAAANPPGPRSSPAQYPRLDATADAETHHPADGHVARPPFRLS